MSAQTQQTQDRLTDDEAGDDAHQENDDDHGSALAGLVGPAGAPGLSGAQGNPAGRTPLAGKGSGLRENPQAVGRSPLQAQHPHERTTDDPAGNAAGEDDQNHDASQENAEAPRPRAGR